jgi:biopolymer transport protein ExbD
MNRMLGVCLVAVSLYASTTPAAGQTAAPALQKGVSVQMAVTHGAVPVPGADEEKAVIVTVTREARAFLGVEPIHVSALTATLETRLANETKKMVYVKADARASYAEVAKVLEAVRRAGVERPVLLTEQREPAKAGAVVPPKGLEVLMGAPSDAETVVVQVVKSGWDIPLKVNGEEVGWEKLQNRLTELLAKRVNKMVVLKAGPTISFAEVAAIADASRAAGGKLVLRTSGEQCGGQAEAKDCG